MTDSLPYEPPMVRRVPETTAAYAAGIFSALAGPGGGTPKMWMFIAQLVEAVGLGTWNPIVLEEAAWHWGKRNLLVGS